ncbi:MAG: hypothetical protein M4579_002850 [Chaenotheca gracillima]|nr:MAG: hypothetical protein M4579_002850 [Chaenotheca gracillima]
MVSAEELLKKPLYVFDLPTEILATLQPKNDGAEDGSHAPVERTVEPEAEIARLNALRKQEDEDAAKSASCALCGVDFTNVQAQRNHVKSDLHSYNLKQKMRGLRSVTEVEFEKLIGDLDESISGSESDESDDEDDNDAGQPGKSKDSTLTSLLRKQAKLSAPQDDAVSAPAKAKRGLKNIPIDWFSTQTLPSNYSLGIYRALLTNAEKDEPAHIVDTIKGKQLSPKPVVKGAPGESNGIVSGPSKDDPHIFLCMIGGGHFAAMVVSLAPKLGKKHTGADQREASVLAHKTFHRYTTRRKQGGSQSANDSSKGAAHSAGSSLRRYNETALISEIRELLAEWKPLIDTAQLLFVRASGSTNRRTLYGPYDEQILHHNDPRIRSFPFSTRRATQAELMRSFVELTRVKISQVDEVALAAVAAAAAAEASKPTTKAHTPASQPSKPKLSKEEETTLFHTSQIQSLIRRSKAPAVLTYFSTHTLSPDFTFHPTDSPQNHHAPTPLHLAASINSPTVVLALLTKAKGNPTLPNGDGKPPFDLAGDRATRDAFRVARDELGESHWDWGGSAHVPPGMTRTEADKREERDRGAAEKAETARRQTEMERLKDQDEERRRHEAEAERKRRGPGSTLGALRERTGAEKRDEEARGMTPEMRAKLERERRARAAEQRIARMQQGSGTGTGN